MSEIKEKQSLSLVGAWKLVRQGSDYIPGIDKLPGSPPIVLKMKGNIDSSHDDLLFIGNFLN